MNILVRTYGGRVIVRPDTTWERDNEDVFLPEFVNKVSWTPVLFVRISKAGRSVSARFASRYYDGVGYGVLLYPENMIDGNEEGFACASCLDHTSFLPFPVHPLHGDGEDAFVVVRDGEEIFRVSGAAVPSVLENAIEEVTRFCHIRTGDIMAIELSPRSVLLCRGAEESSCHVEGTCFDSHDMDFKVIL